MKVASNGLTINVEEKGEGDLSLVFLHYWGGSSRTWKYVTAKLAPAFHTVAIDHRGWGQSDAPAEGYALANLAADAEGVIQALNLKRYMLVGHSMGGKVAQLIASRQPDRLAGLILVAPSPPSPLSMPAQAREVMAGAYSSREAVEAAIDNMLTAKPLSEEDREHVIEDSLRGAAPAKIAWPRATSLEDITQQVGSINVPTAVIAGELDRIDTVEVLKNELLSRVPHAVLHVLPSTGHLSMLESPEEVSRLIGDFAATYTATTDVRAREHLSSRLLAQDAVKHKENRGEKDMQDTLTKKEQVTFVKKEPPQWLLNMWKEIDDKTFGKGFDCFTEDAVCNLGVADWKGREAIRTNLKAFIDTGFTAKHHVTEYWDAGFLKVFRGVVDMKPDDRSKPTVHPTMSHFFYMDEKDQTKVRRWVGAVGPVSFG